MTTVVLRSTHELDAHIAGLEELRMRSYSEWLKSRSQFSLSEDVSSLPQDPFSAEYRASQIKLYCAISGRDTYSPWDVEPVPIVFEQGIDPHPYPFITKSPEHIGNHFIQLGHILRVLAAVKPDAKSLVEFGCGTGFLTLMMAASGYDVTAVDINDSGLRVLTALADARKLKIRTHNGVFGEVPDLNMKYDIILFYESFHHCLDFERLMCGLQDRIAQGGIVIFANEPVYKDFPKPWGLRLDGGAIWEIRSRGWLELGFRDDFFGIMLARCGWSVERHSFSPFIDILVARSEVR